MREDLPIILLSGLAVHERLFESQVAAFPQLRIEKWIDPLPRETLRSYAARLARLIDPGRPCVVGHSVELARWKWPDMCRLARVS